jgi:hypothetical protein
MKKAIKMALPILVGLLASIPIYNILVLEIISVISAMLAPSLLLRSFESKVAGVGVLYLGSLALFISSLLNHTPLDSLLKGVLALILFILTLTFLVQLFNAYELWFALLSYYLFSTYFALTLNSAASNVDLQSSFKFGYSGLLIFLLLSLPLLLSLRPSRSFYTTTTTTTSSSFFVLLVSLVIAFLALWGNLRLLIYCNILAVLTWAYKRFHPIARSPLSKKFNESKLLLSIAMPFFLILSSILITAIVRLSLEILSAINFVSGDALTKSIEQSTGALGILFGGRLEIFASLLAWHDKPIFGWGAWPIDPNAFYSLGGFQIMHNLGYRFSELAFLVDNTINGVSLPWIPTHSFLYQSLVWSGIVGFVPTYWFFCKIVSRFLTRTTRQTPFLIHYLNATAIWSILFSPFGWPNRINLAMILAFTLSYLSAAIPTEKSLNQSV